MKLTFHGAARTVTGSCHRITLEDGRQILLDCGMFQGMGKDTERLNADFQFDPEKIDVLLLTHAHIDHSGLIPKLVKEGFAGKIWCTEPTRDLTEILLFDSAEIQTYESDANNRVKSAGVSDSRPLYDATDVDASLKLFQTAGYNEWITVLDGVAVQFTHTGHLIGSAAITLRIRENSEETTLLYTGDIGRYRSVLLQAPSETPQADYIILESTYGNKHHDISYNTIETLLKWIKKTCVEKGGQLIIPAFSVGRTQEVLYALNQLSLEKRLPEIPYFIDSPLSLKATQTIKKYTGEFNDRLQQVLAIDDDPFEFPGLRYIETVDDSRKLVDYQQPCVIISASGTADAGRVRHHINSCIARENCAILLVGYCGARSLGGQLLQGEKEVDLFGGPCAVRAEIGQVAGMSAHGDSDDLCRFIANQDADQLKQIFLVHGEHEVQKAFADRLDLKGFKKVEIPSPQQSYQLNGTPARDQAA